MSDEDNTAPEGGRSMKIVWDDSRMQMSYANVCNVSSTREEFNLLFGTNQTWARGQDNVRVRLDNRVVLNPHAAKRLLVLLTTALKQHEERFGPIDLDPGSPPQAPETH